jgi:hypothetical protein
LAASSASLPWRTFFPQRVFTKVVRPRSRVKNCQPKVRKKCVFLFQLDIPVPLAPQTMRQNWMPFLTFFFRRILICVKQKKNVLVESSHGQRRAI